MARARGWWRPTVRPLEWPDVVSLVVVVAGVVGVVHLTRHGVLLDSDSAGYLKAARQLAGDPTRWFQRLDRLDLTDTSMHPPAYAFVLGLVARVTGEAAAARVVGAASLVVVAAAVHAIVRAHASSKAALAAMTAVLVSRGVMVRLFAYLMADSLFLALMAGALWATDRSGRATGRARLRWLAAGATMAGAAVTTRADGVGLVVAIGWWVASTTAGAPRRERWSAMGIVAVLGLGPIVAWALAQVGADSVRTPWGWRGATWRLFVDGARSVVQYLVPEPVVRTPLGTVGEVVVLVAAVVGIPVGWWMLRATRGAPAGGARAAVRLLASAGAWHLAVVLVARLWSDRFIIFDARHLAPAWMAFVALIAIVVDRRLASSAVAAPSFVARPRVRMLVVGAALVAVALVGASVISSVRSVRAPGAAWGDLALATRGWPILDAVDDLPPDTVIYANRTDLVYLLTDQRDVRSTPLRTDPVDGSRNRRFADQVDDMVGRLRATSGVVVYIDDGDDAWTEQPSLWVELAGMTVRTTVADGVILECGRACRT